MTTSGYAPTDTQRTMPTPVERMIALETFAETIVATYSTERFSVVEICSQELNYRIASANTPIASLYIAHDAKVYIGFYLAGEPNPDTLALADRINLIQTYFGWINVALGCRRLLMTRNDQLAINESAEGLRHSNLWRLTETIGQWYPR